MPINGGRDQVVLAACGGVHRKSAARLMVHSTTPQAVTNELAPVAVPLRGVANVGVRGDADYRAVHLLDLPLMLCGWLAASRLGTWPFATTL
jgi:hypothetical protein